MSISFFSNKNSAGGRKLNKWLKIILAIFFSIIVILLGVGAAFFEKAKVGNAFLDTLNYIESGAIPDENDDFSRKADLMEKGEARKINLGVYKTTASMNGVHYDTVIVLKPESVFDFAMTVGNGTLHKTYSYSGRWWVEGEVFKTVFVEGDLFLASPASRDRATPMREIILRSDDSELVLQAHFNKEPIVFKKIDEVK